MKVEEAAKSAWFWIGLFTALPAMALGVVSLGGYAKADTVHALQLEQAAVRAVLPLMQRDISLILEIERTEQWRLHRNVIPDPSSPDGGAR